MQITRPKQRSPVIEWLCGPIAQIGKERFRIALDRTWPNSATYIALRQQGNDTIRTIVEPSGINLKGARNTEGKSQIITFEKLPDIKAGTKRLKLLSNDSIFFYSTQILLRQIDTML